ncbi:MAG: SPFH domain / Band 7 family protein [Parcubacteria group bacterium LiPW_15]|nr:MAG: SPFH domain / Band 7 family protein [Parcubacteria group bacterium LiPW_15]
MGEAFAWLGKIFELITALIPRPFIIDATQEGVKFKYGKYIVHLLPGVYGYWPLVTKVVAIQVKRQAVVLKPQVLTTKDGKSVIMGTLIAYTIIDAVAALTEVDNLSETLFEVSQGAVPGVVAGKTLQQLIHDVSEISDAESGNGVMTILDLELCERVSSILRGFGVNVLYCKVTDFSSCRVLNISGDFGSSK